MITCKNPINQTHLKQLFNESRISEKTAIEAGLFSITADESIKLIAHGGSGIAFPYFDTNGKQIGTRVKQDNPQKDDSGKVIGKYLTSKNSDAFIYFRLADLTQILNSESLIIVEGEKKLLAFIQNNPNYSIPALSIAGCWMFRKKVQGENELHDVLEKIIKVKKQITIIPDSDYFENPSVTTAYNRLAKILFARGIIVKIIDIRIKGDTEKIGVDDFLMKSTYETLNERIALPYVIFKNLDENEIKTIITKNGISAETLENIFKGCAFLDKFQILKIYAIFKSIYKINSKDLKPFYLKSKNSFSPGAQNSLTSSQNNSPDNYIKWNNKEDGHDVVLKAVGEKLTETDYVFLKEGFLEMLMITNADYSKIDISDTKEKLYDTLGSRYVIELVYNTEDGEATSGFEPLNKNLVSIFFSYISLYVVKPIIAIVSHTPYYSLLSNKMITEIGHYSEDKLLVTTTFKAKKENHSKIEILLNNTPFRSEVDKENFLGVLISSLAFKNSLPGTAPGLLIRAQEHGSGKSQLASCLQYLIEGKNFGMLTYNNDIELEKHIASQLESSCIIIDNLRLSNLDSPVLEKLITDPKPSFRKLGSQQEIGKVNNTLVIFTMNGGRMTSDLSSRLIVVELSKMNQKKSKGFHPLRYAMENRIEIIEEVLGMIEKADLSQPLANCQSRFDKWETLVSNTMTANGYKLFLSNIKEMHEAIDQDLSYILNFVIKNSEHFSTSKSSTDIFKLIENRKSYNEQNSLSTQKIGKILSNKSNRKIEFQAFDNLRYEFLISKIKTNAGGDNYIYHIAFSLLKPVGSVALIEESNMDKNIIDKEIFQNTTNSNPKINHDPTDAFLEPGQTLVDPELLGQGSV